MVGPVASAAKIAARVRAALAYANIDVKQSKERIGISASTMTRIVSPTTPRGARVEELWVIADACEVPREFMEGGWSAITAIHHGSNNLAERMQSLSEELHERMEHLERELSQALLERAAGEVEHGASQRDTPAADKPVRGQEDRGP